MAAGWLWVLFTVFAAAGQTARNAMQRELTTSLGTAGATHVRFLFGFPFAFVFFLILLALGHPLPHPGPAFWPWIVAGALTQILGTALTLATMTTRSFVVATAYLKTEPIHVALLGVVFLGEHLAPGVMAAIVIATAGVVLISWRSGAEGGIKPAIMGLSAGFFFAISAIAYRAGILDAGGDSYVTSASIGLSFGLLVQTLVLSAWLYAREPMVLAQIFRLWRPSMFAGFLGAAASQGWFLAFALASAASVRTLGLIDVLFAQAVSHIAFKQKTTLREAAGIAVLIAGICLLVWAHGV